MASSACMEMQILTFSPQADLPEEQQETNCFLQFLSFTPQAPGLSWLWWKEYVKYMYFLPGRVGEIVCISTHVLVCVERVELQHVCVRVCVCACVHVRACVSVWDRESGGGRELVKLASKWKNLIVFSGTDRRWRIPEKLLFRRWTHPTLAALRQDDSSSLTNSLV